MNEILVFAGNHPWLTALICSAAGYLIGTVSSARIIYFLATGRWKIEPFAEPVPNSDEVFESDLVSATLVNKKLGAKYGCITAIADMLKVALPMLLVKAAFAEQPYHLLVALFGVAGHNFPVWYGFKGGRGESSIIGALLVTSWSGYLVANLASVALGFITGSVLVMRWGAYFLMPVWLWFQFRDWRYVVFMVLMVLLFLLSMRKDLARFTELKRKRGSKFTEEEVSEFILMGKSPGRMLDRYSLYSLLRRMLSKEKEAGK
ncbi:glycerol-3-phosphate acyltransferase [bacterium]|nr:glycerol-3-phosphate acyltransferase [bacterium]